jgi:hypothetical protein
MRSQYDERIVNVSLNYHHAHSAAKLKLRSSHPALRRINSYFIAEIHELRRQLREANVLMSPVLSKARKQLAANESVDRDNNNNIVTWLLREVNPRQFANDSYLTNILLAYAISGNAPRGRSSLHYFGTTIIRQNLPPPSNQTRQFLQGNPPPSSQCCL